MPKEKSGGKLAGVAALIMLATLFSRITGYVRFTLIYTTMQGKYSDEFLLAFTLPDITFNLLAGGAMAAALIPVLSAYLTKGKEKMGWRAVSTFINLTLLALLVMEVVFYLFTGPILMAIAPGFASRSDEARQMLVDLSRILLLSVPFMILSGVCNGILNSYKKFAASAFGPVLYNVFSIISIALFGATNPYLTSWGIVVSSFLYFLMQLASAKEQFRYYKPVLELRHPAFKRLFSLAMPSIVSSTIVEINMVIGRGYATIMEKGMLTLLNNANRTWQLPLGIFAQSISIALLPTLSSHHAEDNKEEFKSLLYRGLRAIFLLCLPVTLVMMFASRDIMRAMFKWGDAPEIDTFYSGIALLGYASALVYAAVMSLIIRAFYALHDSVTPLISGVVGILVNYLANLWLSTSPIGIAGPAMAYSITAMLNMFMLLVLFQRKTGIRVLQDNFVFLYRCLIAAVPSCIVLWLSTFLLSPNPDGKVSQVFVLGIQGVAGLAVFYGMAVVLKIQEVSVLKRMFLKRGTKEIPTG